MAEDAKTVDDLYTNESDESTPEPGAGVGIETPPVVEAPPAGETPPIIAPVIEPPKVKPTVDSSTADPPNKETPPADDNRPGIDRWLAEYGIEGGMIQFEDGEKVAYSELTNAEQHVVLNSLATKSRPTVEQASELNEDEVGFLNMVRESGKSVADVVAELANNQLTKIRVMEESQSIDWDNMSKDAVYLAFLKEKNPDLTDEDLQEDLDKARDTKTYENTVDGIRKDFKASQDRDREENTSEINKQLDQNIEDDRRNIVETIAPIKEILGFEITDDQKNTLLGDVLELNDSGDSLLLEKIFSDPKTILEAAWFLKYGKSSVTQMENYYKQELGKAYGRGRDEALGKLPDSDMPARIGGLSSRANLTNPDGFNVKPNAKTVDDLYED